MRVRKGQQPSGVEVGHFIGGVADQFHQPAVGIDNIAGKVKADCSDRLPIHDKTQIPAGFAAAAGYSGFSSTTQLPTPLWSARHVVSFLHSPNELS